MSHGIPVQANINRGSWAKCALCYYFLFYLFINNNFSLFKNIFTKMTNKMLLCRIIYCSLTAVRVSGDIFVHHQEHLNCIYSFWFYSLVSLSAGVMAEP